MEEGGEAIRCPVTTKQSSGQKGAPSSPLIFLLHVTEGRGKGLEEGSKNSLPALAILSVGGTRECASSFQQSSRQVWKISQRLVTLSRNCFARRGSRAKPT